VPYEGAARKPYRFSMLRDARERSGSGPSTASHASRTGRHTLFTEKDGLPDDTVHSVYEDAQGTLWIATTSGLCRFREGRFVSFARRDTPAAG
jgi:hypothetical protein